MCGNVRTLIQCLKTMRGLKKAPSTLVLFGAAGHQLDIFQAEVIDQGGWKAVGLLGDGLQSTASNPIRSLKLYMENECPGAIHLNQVKTNSRCVSWCWKGTREYLYPLCYLSAY